MEDTKVIRKKIDTDGIMVATFDDPKAKINTLSSSVYYEIKEIIDEVYNKNIKGIIFASAKENNFIAGADLNELKKFISEEEAFEGSSKVQQLMNELENLPIPTLVAIDGSSMGGGTEFSLAVKYRLASDNPKVVIALPEVMLGLLPGAGGTQRLPRLIGLQAALDMILTGKNIRADKALKIGLIDQIVPAQQLLDHAHRLIREMIDHQLKASRKGFNNFKDILDLRKLTSGKNYADLFLGKTPVGHSIVLKKARDKVFESTRGHYPAPLKILDVIKVGLAKGFAKGLEAEARGFAELAMTKAAGSLIHVFFSINEAKKDNGTKTKSVKGIPITKVGVLGGGLMGAGIATVIIDKCALPVRIKDVSYESLGKAYSYVDEIVSSNMKKKRIPRHQYPLTMGLLSSSTDYTGFKHNEIVIEAVFEDLGLKRQMIADIENQTEGRTIFASNTSSLSIRDLAVGAKYPEKVIGMHFFSPVHKMPLLEIIKWEKNTDEVIATCADLGRKMGKHVIVVNDGVGFYTSRSLGPYMNEAAHLFFEGYSIETIDGCMLDWGFPVGPLTLLDEVGIDVAAKVTHIMLKGYGQRLAPPQGWDRIIDDGRQGRKNGKGFYTYGKSKKKTVDPTIYNLRPPTVETIKNPDNEQLTKRLSLAFVNEAILCLEEGVLRSPRDGDIGAIFGLGFPPFLGGPFRYIDTYGPANVLADLENLADRFGDRFKPAQMLVDTVKTNKKFYD